MALTVSTSRPETLLGAIKKAIDDKRVETWQYDKDDDFTHTPEQWRFKAWLRPEVGSGELNFRIINNKNISMTKEIYAVYHGRFIEMLLAHFDDHFSSAQATAK